MRDSTRATLERLHGACELARDEDFDAYRTAIGELRDEADPEALPGMLAALRDVDAGEVQYELVEACESFPVEVYVPALARAAHAMMRVAPWWSRLMLQSALNSDRCVEVLSQVVPALEPDPASAWLELLGELSRDHDRYASIRDRLAALRAC